MSVHRFYVPGAAATNQRHRLSADEARHLTRVLRLGVGTPVRVFDGQGHEFAARVERARRDDVVIRTLEAVAPTREPSVKVTLAQAVLKGRAFDTVVRDATMLGIAEIRPLITTRTDVPADVAGRPDLQERWQRVAVAAAKQSGRSWVPPVHPVMPLTEHLATTPQRHLMLVEPAAGRTPTSLPTLTADPIPGRVTITAGPEGGWTPAELALAEEHSCVLITLGTRTLRADAIPLTAVSVLLYVWGDL